MAQKMPQVDLQAAKLNQVKRKVKEKTDFV